MPDPDLAALASIPTDLTDEEIATVSSHLDAAVRGLVPGQSCSADQDAAPSEAPPE